MSIVISGMKLGQTVYTFKNGFLIHASIVLTHHLHSTYEMDPVKYKKF